MRTLIQTIAAKEHQTATGVPLGSLALSDITEDELEAFHAGLKSARLAASTRNQYTQFLKTLFRWAVRKGYLARSPMSEESTIKRSKVAQRRRRLSVLDEKALLDSAGTVSRGAGARLQWLIIAALETGARRGELLALMWGDVDLEKGVLLIRAVEEGARKTGRARQLPISRRLAAVLKMAQTDPAGRTYPAAAYVFGQLGERLKGTKKAWRRRVKAPAHR